MLPNNYDGIIVCGANKVPYDKYDYKRLIGVERGCLDILHRELDLDVAVGDFDHVTLAEKKVIKKYAKEIIELSADKDLIDGEAAIQYAQQQKCKRILLICDGSEIEFIGALFFLASKYGVVVQNSQSYMFALQQGVNQLPVLRAYNKISFMALETAEITIKNLVYESHNLQIRPMEPKAIRNLYKLNSPALPTVTVHYWDSLCCIFDWSMGLAWHYNFSGRLINAHLGIIKVILRTTC